jgi:YVTN family beta-propeller protein
VPVGKLPHGVWPSGDGTRIYVGLENDDKLAAIDTATNTVIGTVPIGQAPQAIAYVPNAVPVGAGTANLQPLGKAGEAVHLTLAPRGADGAPTSVSLFDQGLIQIVQGSVTGLQPKHAYVLALATTPDGSGPLEPLASFTANPAGSAIVNAAGQIRQLVSGELGSARRWLVVADAANGSPGIVLQVQRD